MSDYTQEEPVCDIVEAQETQEAVDQGPQEAPTAPTPPAAPLRGDPLTHHLDTITTWLKVGAMVVPGYPTACTVDGVAKVAKQPMILFGGIPRRSQGDRIGKQTKMWWQTAVTLWEKQRIAANPLILVGKSNLVDVGGTFAVVDADGDVEIHEPWIFSTFGTTPLIVETGREGGGRHYWYRLPEGVDGKSVIGEIGAPDAPLKDADRNGKRNTKVDLKAGNNAVIVAPGAIHKSGRVYKTVGDVAITPELIASLPILDMAKVETAKAEMRPKLVAGMAKAKVEAAQVKDGANPQPVAKPSKFLDNVDLSSYDGEAKEGEIARIICPAACSAKQDTSFSIYRGPTGKAWGKCHRCDCRAGAVPKAGPSGIAWREKNEDGKPLANSMPNTLALLGANQWQVAQNEMTHQVEFRKGGRLISPDLAGSMIRNAARDERYGMSLCVYDDHILEISQENSYHPVLAWLGGGKWDGVNRIPDLGCTLSVEQAKYRKIHDYAFYRWVLGAAAALIKPDGVKAEGVLVLAGPQGCGKTSWFASLAPVGVLTGASLDPSDKDSVIHATSSWLVELGELDATFRRADLARLKAFLSQTEDRIRLPYGRAERSMPRRTVFMASVNDEEYLQDRTGNRRYWTFPVTACNALHGIDMKQLWLQAIHLVRGGERWWLDAAEMADLTASNIKHLQLSPIEEALGLLVCAPQAAGQETSATEIREAVLTHLGVKADQRNITEMGKVLRRTYGEPRKSHGKLLYPCLLVGTPPALGIVDHDAMGRAIDNP